MTPSLPGSPSGGRAVLATLALLSVFPPLATDMYLSAFGDIADYLGAADGTLELSLSVFFLGLCCGQLLFGPLIDRYGRKGPLLVGAATFCVATGLLLATQSAPAFVAIRFVQAIGASAGMVVGRAVVLDLYERQQAARAITLLVMLTTIGPVVSPLLGSVLVTQLGWKSVFVAMLGIGAVALVLTALVLPETLRPSERRRSSPASILRGYAALATRRDFLLPALTSSLAMGAMFSFITASFSVLQGVAGLGKVEYGLAFGFVALGLVAASLLNTRLLAERDARSIVGLGLPGFVAATLALLAVSGSRDLAVLIAPLWGSVAAAGLVNANASAIAMEAARGQGGLGSAVLGAMQFAIASLVSSVVAANIADSALPLAIGMLVPAALAQAVWLLASRSRPRPAAEGSLR